MLHDLFLANLGKLVACGLVPTLSRRNANRVKNVARESQRCLQKANLQANAVASRALTQACTAAATSQEFELAAGSRLGTLFLHVYKEEDGRAHVDAGGKMLVSQHGTSVIQSFLMRMHSEETDFSLCILESRKRH